MSSVISYEYSMSTALLCVPVGWRIIWIFFRGDRGQSRHILRYDWCKIELKHASIERVEVLFLLAKDITF